MKKSILALSAAAALGGLGFAGSAHAIAYFGNGAGLTANAAATELAAGNIGHFLFTPYYSVQGNMNTLLNIANTDMTNGKAVKVRFRGAANSDDVLDFTVFLSPGDVWTASLTQGSYGRAQISTPDTSCTLPPQTDWPGHFSSQLGCGSVGGQTNTVAKIGNGMSRTRKTQATQGSCSTQRQNAFLHSYDSIRKKWLQDPSESWRCPQMLTRCCPCFQLTARGDGRLGPDVWRQ